MTWYVVKAGLVEEGSDVWSALSGAGNRLLFKHSPHCIVSMGARRRMLELSEVRPELSIYEVDVIHDRGTSNDVESRTSIRHESPQAILFCDGEAVWHASHGAVTVEAVQERLDGATAGSSDAAT